MNRLFEIASALGQLYQTRAQTNLLKWQAEQDIHARQLELTPADGWPGKNAEQRDVARDQTFAEDAQLQEAVKKANDAHRALIELEARIQALEAERRAAEWSIRLRQVEALEGRPRGDHHSKDGRLFDEQVEHEIEEQMLDGFDPAAEAEEEAAYQQHLDDMFSAQAALEPEPQPDDWIPF